MLPRDTLALGGLLGPAAFVLSWGTLGLLRPGYRPLSDTISQLAAVDSSDRLWMQAGFVLYGCGLALASVPFRSSPLLGRAAPAILVSGVSSLAVALTPLGGPLGGLPHYVAAGAGYVSLAAAPLLVASGISKVSKRGAAVSVALGALSAAALAVSVSGVPAGGWQRLGLTLGDLWVVGASIWLYRSTRSAALRPGTPVPGFSTPEEDVTGRAH